MASLPVLALNRGYGWGGSKSPARKRPTACRAPRASRSSWSPSRKRTMCLGALVSSNIRSPMAKATAWSCTPCRMRTGAVIFPIARRSGIDPSSTAAPAGTSSAGGDRGRRRKRRFEDHAARPASPPPGDCNAGAERLAPKNDLLSRITRGGKRISGLAVGDQARLARAPARAGIAAIFDARPNRCRHATSLRKRSTR